MSLLADGHLSVLHDKNFNVEHCVLTSQPDFYIPAILVLCRHHDLDHGWWSQGQQKSKHASFVFSHTFLLVRMKSDVALKQFEFKILSTVLNESS